jgi:hypothetical protein
MAKAEFTAEAMRKVSEQYDQEWEIHWEMPYSEWMEFGAGPHGISQEGQDAILAWVQRKLGLKGDEAIKAANAIMWKIRKKGAEAHPFVRPAIDEIVPKVAGIMAKNRDGMRAVCEAIVTRSGELLAEHGNEDTGALASHVSVRRVR